MPSTTTAEAMKLPATVTLAQASGVLRMIEAEVPASSGVLAVDAGALEACDSSALAVLLEARRQAMSREGTLAIVNPPPKLVALAKLYGVAELLKLSPSDPPPGNT